jgi:hypothetical protein
MALSAYDQVKQKITACLEFLPKLESVKNDKVKLSQLKSLQDMLKQKLEEEDSTLVGDVVASVHEWLGICADSIDKLLLIIVEPAITDTRKDEWIDKTVASFPLTSPWPDFSQPMLDALESTEETMANKIKILRFIDYFLKIWKAMQKQSKEEEESEEEEEEEEAEEQEEEEEEEEEETETEQDDQ